MKKWLLCISYLLLLSKSFAQIEARMSLDTNWLLVGEQTTLRITLEYPPADTMDVQWPELKDTLTRDIEVVESDPIDTTVLDAGDEQFLFQLEKRLVVTAFESGYFAIPPVSLNVNGKKVETNPLLLEVHLADLPPDAQMKDIKGVIEPEWTFMDWLLSNLTLVIVIVLILIAVTIFIFSGGPAALRQLLFGGDKKPIDSPAQPKVPAHVSAINKLKDLQEGRLWQKGMTKEYYIRLSNILREYLEEQFGINAQEETSRDILAKMRYSELEQNTLYKLRELLLLADLVKFAKEKPTPQENEKCLQYAFKFVNETTPITEPEKEGGTT